MTAEYLAITAILRRLNTLAGETRASKRTRKENGRKITTTIRVPTALALAAQEALKGWDGTWAEEGTPLGKEIIRRIKATWKLPARGRQHWFADGSSISRPHRETVVTTRYCAMRDRMVTKEWWLATYNRVFGLPHANLVWTGPIGLPGNREELAAKAARLENRRLEVATTERIEDLYARAYAKVVASAWEAVAGLGEAQAIVDCLALLLWQQKVLARSRTVAGEDASEVIATISALARKGTAILDGFARRMPCMEAMAMREGARAVAS